MAEEIGDAAPLSVPESWSSITQINIDTRDILGTGGLDRRASAQRAVGAFEAPTRSIGPADALFLVADRAPSPQRRMALAGGDAARLVERVVAAEPVAGASLRHVRTMASAAASHEVYQQQVRGHDVVGGRVALHTGPSGPFAVSGHPLGDLATRDPGPPPKSATRRVRDHIRRNWSVVDGAAVEVTAVVLPSSGSAQWAWFVKVPLADPQVDVRMYLAVDDLAPLLVFPSSVNALYGEADVHLVNPARNAVPIRVCLRDLGPDPADGLSGARLTVTTDLGDPVRRTEREFVFDPDTAEFDEASAYHHASEALRYFAGIFRPELFTDPLFTPLRVIVHDRLSANNAYFHPDRGVITLGDFSAGPTAARSADIVYHEVGHAIAHATGRLSATPSAQAKGLGEGYSDYFACSALDDPRFGDYVMNQPNGARNCAKANLARLTGNLDQVKLYTLGESWANALWGIRTACGASVADAIVAESLYFAQGISTAKQALAALLAADVGLFPTAKGKGRHAAVIKREFAARF